MKSVAKPMTMSTPKSSESTYAGFEGSFLGDASRVSDQARLECKICWHVYDPKEGDPVWQIAVGTPFSQLPDHWRCPECDGDKDQFMVLEV